MLHLRTGELRYATAGHEPPLIVPAEGRLRVLEAVGPLMGAFPTLDLREGATRLAQGT